MTSLLINMALTMARLTILIKQKRDQPANSTTITTKQMNIFLTFFLLDLSWFFSLKYLIYRLKNFLLIIFHRSLGYFLSILLD